LRRRSRRGAMRIEQALENLARLEREDAARADRDRLAGLRVAAHALALRAHDEVAEARDLDLLTFRQHFLHPVQDGLHELRRFLLREAADLLVDAVDDLRLRHRLLLQDVVAVPPRRRLCKHSLATRSTSRALRRANERAWLSRCVKPRSSRRAPRRT